MDELETEGAKKPRLSMALTQVLRGLQRTRNLPEHCFFGGVSQPPWDVDTAFPFHLAEGETEAERICGS